MKASPEHDRQPAVAKSVATVATENPSRLINRLCKHWGHKFPVRHDEREGEIELSIGHCHLGVVETGLAVSLQAESPEQLQQLQQVVTDHLQRMASGEVLSFDWH